MALVLKSQYDLAVLKVTLLPGSSARERSAEQVVSIAKERSAEETVSMAKVQFVIEGAGNISPVTVPARDMGIPRRLDWEQIRGRGGYSFQLPPEFTQWLDINKAEIEQANRVLWLQLVKPYGYLGMFPWEKLLKSALSCPILRLPDFVVDPPQQTPSVVDIALCCPLGKTNLPETIGLLAKTAKALSGSGGHRTARVKVFADVEICQQLSRVSDLANLSNVSFHDVEPGESFLTTYVVNPIASVSNPIREWLRKFGARDQGADLLAAAIDPVKSPWLRAVRKALGGQSVDVVHLFANAMLSLESGVLLIDQTEHNSQSLGSHAVSAQEFLAFQAQVGAWAVGLSSTPDPLSDMGLRQFADNLAQLRPGPLLYHDAVADPLCIELSDAYAFLLSELPTTPRRLPATFVYSEPFRVFDERAPGATLESLSLGYEETPANAAVRSVFQKSDNVPAWVAASERFVDLYKMRLAELASKGGSAASSVDFDEIKSTLARLQSAVVKVVKDERS